MAYCIGGVLSVDCGEKGYFQGKLSSIDPDTKNIELVSVFKDGVPVGKSIVINGADIVNLKVLRTAVENNGNEIETNTQNGRLNARKATHFERSKSANSAICGTNTKQWNGRSDHSSRICQDSSSFSSSDETHLRRYESYKPRCSKKLKAVSADPAIVDNTPTPLYKKYEPQVPRPMSLSVESNPRKGKGKQGPSGVPLIDVRNGYGFYSQRNAELNKPIDFDTLESDFDFDANLKLFNEDGAESDDAAFFEEVEMKKVSNNYAHYENILSDPTRITSWTSLSANNTTKCHQPSSSQQRNFTCNIVTNDAGIEFPCMDKNTKEKFLRECSRFFDVNCFNHLLADRILSYILTILNKFSLLLKRVVVLAGIETNKKLLDSVSRALSNRGISVFVYGSAVEVTNLTTCTMDIEGLPDSPDMLLVLSEQRNCAIMEWIGKHRETHTICLELLQEGVDPSKLHILLIQTLTAGLYRESSTPLVGRTSFALLCKAIESQKNIDCCTVDMGIPYSWFDNSTGLIMSSLYSTRVSMSY